ncbi:MAG: transglycosylase domain-containing protein [Chitinispirillaceae bacterium]
MKEKLGNSLPEIIKKAIRFLMVPGSRNKVLLFIPAVPFFFLYVAFLASLFTISLKGREPSLLLEDRYHSFIGALENEIGTFGYWPLPDTLPEKIPILLKAAEDHRFDNHLGVDPFSVTRAFIGNYITGKEYSGASTIAMQVARMQGAGTDRSLFYKVREAFTAVWLTFFFGREDVLSHYLTIAPYGNRISGINYAARRYFKKPLADLSWAETALLTAVPNAPGTMNLYRENGLRIARKRARRIIRRAYDLEWLDEKEKGFALEELANLPRPAKELRQDNMLHPIFAANRHVKSRSSNITLDPHNPTLRLTLDTELQDMLTTVAFKHMDELRPKGADNIAIMVLKRETGEILAYSGSDYYFDDAHAGQIDFAEVKRSTGSTLKPFIYSYGMEWNGYTPATLLTDLGLYFGTGDDPFIPQNYDDQFLGPVLYKFALANSRNVPAIQVLNDVGLDLTYERLADLGLTEDDGNADHYGLGLAVGNLYSSLHQLCRAYLVLANGGKYRNTHWLYGESDSSDTRLIERDVALQIQRILSDPQARLPSFPPGSYLEYPYPVALKTGTSRGFRDAWTVGWSDTYLVGVWIGRHDHESMKGLSGFSAAAPVVQDIFTKLHPERKEGLSNLRFPPPKGYKPFRINTLTGELNSEHSPFTTTIYLKPGTEPTTYSRVERWLPIDKRNGLLASQYCPGEHVVSKRFIALPPIFKDWAEVQDLQLPPKNHSPLCDGAPVVDDYDISIIAPQNKSRLFMDPEMPQEQNMLMLNCMVEPRASEVMWIVDGKEYAVSKFPYREAWPLSPGEHTFQVQIPFTQCASDVITVEVY